MAGKLATAITDEFFKLGSRDSIDKCQRIQFMTGSYPENEKPNGGLCERSFSDLVERVINSFI